MKKEVKNQSDQKISFKNFFLFSLPEDAKEIDREDCFGISQNRVQ